MKLSQIFAVFFVSVFFNASIFADLKGQADGEFIDRLEELSGTAEYHEGELDIDAMATCTKSTQCFSYEYCHKRGECVDAAKEPCEMNADCVAGESCQKNSSPYKCR